MYAWDIGVAANDLNILCEGHPETTLISQPPHDLFAYNATMYHYTWGIIVKDAAGIEIWKFDKRFYTGRYTGSPQRTIITVLLGQCAARVIIQELTTG